MTATLETSRGVRSARTRLKICGLRTPADVDEAVAAGADAVGFVLWARSARAVTAAQAGALAARLPAFVTPVLLFVNATDAEWRAGFDAVPHALAQLHGDETPQRCLEVGRPWLRAARMRPGVDLLDFAAQHAQAAGLVLDTHVEGYGGSGKAFDWSLIPSRGVGLPVVLSGGLHAGNVSDGIRAVRPFAVDVSSGVESERGRKDHALMHAFAAAVRAADLEGAAS